MADPVKRFPEPPRPQATGRHLVVFKSGADMQAAASDVKKSTGARTIDSREMSASPTSLNEALAQGSVVFNDRFKVAVISPGGAAAVAMAALQASQSVQSTRPEFYMYAINDVQKRYADWVRAGLRVLADGAPTTFDSGLSTVGATAFQATAMADTDEFTWGLMAVGAHRSAYTGRGVRVAVLDTGIDLGHPDVVGRQIATRSFVAGEDVQDVQGHGTHTAGTVAGPRQSKIGRRYGVAPDAELHIGKVLDNGGTGREFDIIEGINWAIEQKCAVISMSLGRPTGIGEPPDPLYEAVGAAALREAAIIIAAAGNDSSRDFNFIASVGAPANAPSIMAVAAVDPAFVVAEFSSGGLNANGGEVNISGPGVSVYSAFPRPRLSRTLQGTSMACPHVAGVAALWVQSDPVLRGRTLWAKLERTARELGSMRDFGRGLVLAPDAGLNA